MQEFKDIEEFVKFVNKKRLENKNKWYYIVDTIVCGKAVEIKAFGTWMQIFNIDGMKNPSTHDLPVGKFKNCLRKPFLN